MDWKLASGVGAVAILAFMTVMACVAPAAISAGFALVLFFTLAFLVGYSNE